MSNAQVGATLRTLRGEKSRAEVSRALCISISALSMYENGARSPRDEIKKRIAAYYNRSVEEIFFSQ